MSDQLPAHTPAEMTPDELRVYSAERLKTIAVQNAEIIQLLDKIRGGVQFFVVLTVITLILNACAFL